VGNPRSILPPWYLEHRYAILFYSLLLTIAAGPLSETLGFGRGAIEILLGMNMLAAVLPIGDRFGRRILFALFSVAVIVNLFSWYFETPEVSLGGFGGWTIIGLIAAISALRFSLRTRVVTSEHLHAALSAYVLAGMFFGVGYWILEMTWPGSLLIGGGEAGPDFSPVNAIYFSFVTLATLGYGDIVPRTDAARGIAIVEAVLGQLYLAVLVARLVSSYVAKRGN
jgi:voltage-gated potassium channel Kch